MLKNEPKFIEITKITKQNKIYPMFRVILQMLYKDGDDSKDGIIELTPYTKKFLDYIKYEKTNKLIELIKSYRRRYLLNTKKEMETFSKFYFYQRMKNEK